VLSKKEATRVEQPNSQVITNQDNAGGRAQLSKPEASGTMPTHRSEIIEPIAQTPSRQENPASQAATSDLKEIPGPVIENLAKIPKRNSLTEKLEGPDQTATKETLLLPTQWPKPIMPPAILEKLSKLPEALSVVSPETDQSEPFLIEEREGPDLITETVKTDLAPGFEIEASSINAKLDEILLEEDGVIDLQTEDQTIYESLVIANYDTEDADLPEYPLVELEATPELLVPMGQVEQTIIDLTDRIGELGLEQTEIVHQTLDDIALKADEVRSLTETEKVVATEELEEQLVQLFDYAEIEYTPELIESFVKLTLMQDVPELILKIDQTDTVDTPEDKGTHEIIKQLLAAVSNIKKTAMQAYSIGKSAVYLYSRQYMPA
jgi:hypothetical protein